MGNRSYLVLSTAIEAVPIAEANNDIPLLWQYLLASGTPKDDRSDHSLSQQLAIPLPEAIHRANQVLDFIAQYSAGNRLPYLAGHTQVLQAYLQQLLRDYGEDAELTGSFEEIAWLEDDYDGDSEDFDQNDFINRFVPRLKAEFLQGWQKIEATIKQQDWQQFEQMIGTPSATSGQLWQFWQFSFGLTSFDDALLNRQFTEVFVQHCTSAQTDDSLLPQSAHQPASSATAPTTTGEKIISSLIWAVIFGGIYWLLRDTDWLRFIPLVLGAFFCSAVWYSPK